MDEAREETRRNTRNTKIMKSTRKHKYQADDNDDHADIECTVSFS